MVISRVEGAKSSNGGSSGGGKGKGICTSHSTTKLTSMNQGKHIAGKALIVSVMQNSAGSSGDTHQWGPITSQKSMTAVPKGSVHMGGGSVAGSAV